MVGRVIRCKKDKGYAFIRAEDNNIYFCHFSNTDDGVLDVGYQVSFRVAYDWKLDNVQAKDVKIIDSWYRAYN